MDHVRFDPTCLKPARQPEAVAAGFEGKRNPRDRAAFLAPGPPARCCTESRAEGAHNMPDDVTEFKRAIQALLDRYPKARILAALQETSSRPGPKRGRLGDADPDGLYHDVAQGSF